MLRFSDILMITALFDKKAKPCESKALRKQSFTKAKPPLNCACCGCWIKTVMQGAASVFPENRCIKSFKRFKSKDHGAKNQGLRGIGNAGW